MNNKLFIFFDVDDTLYNQREPFIKAFETVFSDIKDIDLEKFYRDRHRFSDEVFEKSCKGEITMEEMYIYRISKAFLEQGIIIEDSKALDFQYEYSKNQGNIEISHTMKNILDFCNDNNIGMGIITNGPFEHQMKKIKTLEIDKWIKQDNIFISEKVGYLKPEKEIFEMARKVCLDSDIYYVGDSFKNDIEGANGAGFKTVWLNRRNYNVESDVKPDYCVKNESELFQVIKNIYNL